jgi:hypothetical protein
MGALIDTAQIPGAFKFETGFHRPDWIAIGEWINRNVHGEERQEAWNEAVLQWLELLRQDLGGDYFILQSRQTFLLSEQPRATARWLLDYASRVVDTVEENLGAIAWQGSFGKDVVLVFSDEDDYYQYLAYHSPDGEQAASGGVCIHSGYTHIAFPWRDAFEAANTLVHELTHDCLASLPLPLWLNEGIAVTLQKLVAPPSRPIGQSEHEALFSAAIDWRAPIMWDELAERHFEYWNEETIQAFWAGPSFFKPGDASELSYSLAEVLVKLLGERGNRNSFLAFVEAAQQEDAGQTASMEILGTDLGDVAGAFLGEGNWRPRRKALVECWNDPRWKEPVPASRADDTSGKDTGGLA